MAGIVGFKPTVAGIKGRCLSRLAISQYPGVFIDYVRKDGATAILACVEYDPNKEALQTVVYGNCASDEPTEIVEHYNTDFEE